MGGSREAHLRLFSWHSRVIGFPYRLIYWTDGEYSLVVAIAHAKRRPGYGKDRMK